LSDTLVNPTVTTSQPDPQRLAWGVLLISFAIFCLICVISGIGVNYFLFQSAVPMESRLLVGRGTVGIIQSDSPESEQAERRERILSDTNNVTMQTDAQSQATLAFRDDALDQLVASVTLKNNTSLSLRTASRPRFDWNSTAYYVELTHVSGELDVILVDNLLHNIQMSARAPSGAIINLVDGGQYTIDISDARIRVMSQRGNAVLIPPDYQSPRLISAGAQGVLYADRQEIAVEPAYVDLLVNSDFSQITDQVNTGETQQLLEGWVCANDPNDNPRGSYRSQIKDGRMTLRLVRGDNAETHGRTSCIQTFGQTGLAVSPDLYDYLALRASFYIEHQSLNACGIDGSECPLMLRMDYRQGDNVYQWFHGFYAVPLTPEQGYPLRCSSCSQDHEAVNGKAWYTYDSGNLFTLFPAEQRPDSIVGVWFYASGHQYDVFVSEVSLLAGQQMVTQTGQNAENTAESQSG